MDPMKTGMGKRAALVALAIALAVLGVLAFVVSTGRFTLRYEIGNLLEEWQKPHEGPTLTLQSVIVTFSPEEAKSFLRLLLVEYTGGEDRLGAGSLRIESTTLIARLTLAHHWDLWRVLGHPPLP
jgi:hypothetical protein